MTAPTTDKSHLLRFGYAPGEYGHGQCVDCEQKFYGNKSARRCETCAESLYAQITSVEAVADKHRAMTTLPEEAVKAADIIQVITDLRSAILQDDDEGLAEHAAPMVKAKELIVKLSASPFLTALEPSAAPCPCTKIQQDETCPVGYPSLLCEICDGKGVVQPSEARELALEEAAQAAENAMLEYNLSECAGLADWAAFEAGQESGLKHAATAIRALSSPDHIADAGKLDAVAICKKLAPYLGATETNDWTGLKDDDAISMTVKMRVGDLRTLKAVATDEADAGKVEGHGLPQDVINLVIAAREVWEEADTLSYYHSDEEFSQRVKALDKALEPFGERVPFENEPDALPSAPSEGAV